jgi:hypothetical protein
MVGVVTRRATAAGRSPWSASRAYQRRGDSCRTPNRAGGWAGNRCRRSHSSIQERERRGRVEASGASLHADGEASAAAENIEKENGRFAGGTEIARQTAYEISAVLTRVIDGDCWPSPRALPADPGHGRGAQHLQH